MSLKSVGKFPNIRKENIDKNLLSSFKIKDDLNRDIWDNNDQLKPNIRENLLIIGKDFFDYLELNTEIKDILLTGSLANYNWSKYSDIDLHIVFDFNDVKESDDPDFIKEYVNSKRSLWNNTHTIKIKGFDVEVYPQNLNEPHKSTGLYSILKNEWLIKPEKEQFRIDYQSVKNKAEQIMKEIDNLYDELNKNKTNLTEQQNNKIQYIKWSDFKKNNLYYDKLIKAYFEYENKEDEELYGVSNINQYNISGGKYFCTTKNCIEHYRENIGYIDEDEFELKDDTIIALSDDELLMNNSEYKKEIINNADGFYVPSYDTYGIVIWNHNKIINKTNIKEEREVDDTIKDWKKRKKAEYWFVDEILPNIEIKTHIKIPNHVFYVDKRTGYIYMEYDKESKYLWVDTGYEGIWEYLMINYSHESKKIKELIEFWAMEYLKILDARIFPFTGEGGEEDNASSYWQNIDDYIKK